jgi:hypothetical protein
VTASDNTCLGRDVAQAFPVSAGGRSVAYGTPRWQSDGTRTELFVDSLPDGRRLSSVVVDEYAEPIGFLGERVLISVGDALGGVAVWDPETGDVDAFPGYRGGGATEATSRRAVLYEGDADRPWGLGTWADSFDFLNGGNQMLSRPAFSAEGRWLAGIRGGKSDSHSRLDVYSTVDAHPHLLSEALPGAFQPAWEDDSTVLVLGTDGDGTNVVYRCHSGGDAEEPCSPVWAEDAGQGNTTWIVPRATDRLPVTVDHGNGFTMWPEHRGVDARGATVDPPVWRTDPHSTAEEFGRRVLGWTDPRAEIDGYEHFGVHVVLRRADGLSVNVWLNPVAHGCWSVTGVSRAADSRPEGVSAKVDGRHVHVHVLPLGAHSADVIVGFNGREIRERVIGDSGADIELKFDPKGSGFFIVLLRDFDGRVFSAAGSLRYPGLVAG